MPSVLRAIHSFIKDASDNPDPFYPIPPCSDFTITPYSVQFTCAGLDVDVIVTYDWDSDGGGYVGLYGNSITQETARGRQW